MPLLLTLLAAAQVDSGLLTKSWEKKDHWADTRDKPIVIPGGRIRESDEDFQVFHWDSNGRVKFDRTDPAPRLWAGYRALTVDFNTGADELDHTYADVAVALAADLGAIGDGWRLGASAGAGTANDGRWDERESYFPVAGLVATRSVDGLRHVGISLDGNRPLFPGFPIPVITVEGDVAAWLRVRLGLPQTELRARLGDVATAVLRWDYPTNGLARLEAPLGSGWSVFGEASRRIDGFHLRDRDETRLFYRVAFAEAGVRWMMPLADVSLSTGYAFRQKLLEGFDLRDLEAVGTPEDRPFIALTVQGTF